MWEMLHDITHNGIWGMAMVFSSVIFLGYLVLISLFWIMQKICRKRIESWKNICKVRKRISSCKNCGRKSFCKTSRKRWKRIGTFLSAIMLNNRGHFREIHIVILAAVLLICIGNGIGFAAWERNVEENRYVFLYTSLGTQTDSEVLFLKQETEIWKEKEYAQKLHILEEKNYTEITEENVYYYQILLKDAYQEGEKSCKLVEDSSAMAILREEVQGKKSNTLDEYKEEFAGWNKLYENSGRPKDLYHCGRTGGDILEVGISRLTDDELWEYSSAAVYDKEIFLQYKDRNINTAEIPVIREIKDIAFLNAKVYYQLAEQAVVRERFRPYRNDFWMLAYTCILEAEDEVTEADKDYVKVNYYAGNIEEKMLNYIPSGTPFYATIGESALEHYSIVLEGLEKNPGYYDIEENMQKNTEDGIRTLKELLKR